MSQTAAATLSGETDRDLLDQLQVRMPGVFGLMSAGIVLVRHGSPLRRRLVSWSVKRGFSAMNRSDVDLLVLLYEPDAKVWMRGMEGVGVRHRYLGQEGVRELYAELDSVFSDWSYTIRAVVDLADRIAVRADFFGRGRGSGVETALNDVGTLAKLSARGKIVEQSWYVESGGWAQALQAVGLSE